MIAVPSKFFTASLLDDFISLMEGIDLEGKDIPGVTIDTIEYLFEHGEKINIDNTAKEKYSNHFNDFMDPMKLSLLKEQDNNFSINEIYDLAKEINDYEELKEWWSYEE